MVISKRLLIIFNSLFGTSPKLRKGFFHNIIVDFIWTFKLTPVEFESLVYSRTVAFQQMYLVTYLWWKEGHLMPHTLVSARRRHLLINQQFAVFDDICNCRACDVQHIHVLRSVLQYVTYSNIEMILLLIFKYICYLLRTLELLETLLVSYDMKVKINWSTTCVFWCHVGPPTAQNPKTSCLRRQKNPKISRTFLIFPLITDGEWWREECHVWRSATNERQYWAELNKSEFKLNALSDTVSVVSGKCFLEDTNRFIILINLTITFSKNRPGWHHQKSDRFISLW